MINFSDIVFPTVANVTYALKKWLKKRNTCLEYVSLHSNSPNENTKRIDKQFNNANN